MGFIKNLIYSISNKKMIPFFKRQPIFPYYHIISDEKLPHVKHLYKYKSIQSFKKDIEVLSKYYEPIDIKNVLLTYSERLIIPENSFLLSFDDGLKEVYDIVFPILREKNIKAIFFINPNFIDNENYLLRHKLSFIVAKLEGCNDMKIKKKIGDLLSIKDNDIYKIRKKILTFREEDKPFINEICEILEIDFLKENIYLTKSQIKEIIDAGFFIGAHTMSHPRLTLLSLEKQKEEIINSIKWVRSNFKLEYSFFAFPYSDKGISKEVFKTIFAYDEKAIVFGNSGLKKDIDERVIQRFSLEDPNKDVLKQIITENIYKIYNKIIFKHKIKRF